MWIGGRIQGTGASLIFKAEDGYRFPRRRLLLATVAFATLAAVWLVQANADVAIPGRVISNRANAGGW